MRLRKPVSEIWTSSGPAMRAFASSEPVLRFPSHSVSAEWTCSLLAERLELGVTATLPAAYADLTQLAKNPLIDLHLPQAFQPEQVPYRVTAMRPR